jgi:hypothetical protein
MSRVERRDSTSKWFEKQSHAARAYGLATFVVSNAWTYRETVGMAQQMADRLAAQLPPETAATAAARAKTWTLADVMADVMADPQSTN